MHFRYASPLLTTFNFVVHLIVSSRSFVMQLDWKLDIIKDTPCRARWVDSSVRDHERDIEA